jgi:hypothetical protein
MKPLFAAVLALACIVGSTNGFARGVGSSGRAAAAGTGHRGATAEVLDETPIFDDSDPTDDGFIIIECVAFGRPPGANVARTSNSDVVPVGLPQYPLGPSRCSPTKEYKRT